VGTSVHKSERAADFIRRALIAYGFGLPIKRLGIVQGRRWFFIIQVENWTIRSFGNGNPNWLSSAFVPKVRLQSLSKLDCLDTHDCVGARVEARSAIEDDNPNVIFL
jgi:hypothetical protein